MSTHGPAYDSALAAGRILHAIECGSLESLEAELDYSASLCRQIPNTYSEGVEQLELLDAIAGQLRSRLTGVKHNPEIGLSAHVSLLRHLAASAAPAGAAAPRLALC